MLISGTIVSFAQSVDVLSTHADVGNVQHTGRTSYDKKNQRYILTGSGANIWGKEDQFHFAYRRLQGNFILQAKVKLEGKGVDPHRKAGWMIRSSLATDAVMAAGAVHGDGLVSLQFRREPGKDVEELKSPVTGPDVIQLERRDSLIVLSVAEFGEPFSAVQVSKVEMGDEVFAGLFICSHNNAVKETAIFENVRVVIPPGENFTAYRDYLGSYLEVMDIATRARSVIHAEPRSLQAPNYRDRNTLIYNSEGLIYSIPAEGGKPAVLNTGDVKQNNNDHVVSFDGKLLGLSSSSGEKEYGSLVYVVPIEGGTPRRITPLGPSYLHGFSPDGKWVTYTGLRNKDYDIYKIPVDGGEEVRLTDAAGLDDGSEYSPDGRFIYFNSARTGKMQLWRMKPDGSSQEQLTDDEFNNWFPHISPDGKWIAFLSYQKEVRADDHPFYKQVYLRLMPADLSTKPVVIAYVYGGQGTINTPSWSPDSKRIAFISNTDIIPKTKK